MRTDKLPILYTPHGGKIHWNLHKDPMGIVVGRTNSSKTYCLIYTISIVSKYTPMSDELYILDYKRGKDWAFAFDHPNYYGYEDTLQGFNKIYDMFLDRLEGRDRTSNNLVFVVIDEMASWISSIRERKLREEVQYKLGQLLRMGRSCGAGGGFRILLVAQQPSANLFGGGTADRDQLSLRISLGGGQSSEMIRMMFDITEDSDIPSNQPIGRGFYQVSGKPVRKIVVPRIKDLNKAHKLIIAMLNRSIEPLDGGKKSEP